MTNGAIRFAVYAALGIVVGLIVAAVEWITLEVALHHLIEAPVAIQIIVPIIGFLVVPMMLRQWTDVTAATSDSYIESYHSGHGAEPQKLWKKLIASVATIGSGGAVGLEGAAVLTGATIGQYLGNRRPDIVGQRSRLNLVVAGAAAGVASLFKAPATGVLFAMESPYRRDISRHGLVPALVAAASAYVTFVFLVDDDRLLDFSSAEISQSDGIIAAILIGFLGAGISRGLAQTFRWAKTLDVKYPMRVRLPIASALTAGSLLLAIELVGEPATLGPGAGLVGTVVQNSDVALGAVVVLFLLRVVVTGASLAMSGVGGLFIPLVVQGLLLGRAVEIVVDAPSTGLYPVLGLAAVLGAAYRTPLAAIMFVAESTGRAEFVIPAIITTAISQMLMGDVSASIGQRSERQGDLERRLDEPSSAVMLSELGVLSPEMTLLDVIDEYGDHPAAPAVAVGSPGYVGLLVLHDVAAKILELGPEASVEDSMRHIPAVNENAPAMDAARLMNEHDTAAVAIVNDDEEPVGIVSAMSLAGLNNASLLATDDDEDE